MERHGRRPASVAIAIGLSLLAASCGDASSDSPPDPVASPTATEATDPASPTSTAAILADLPVGDPPALDVRAGTEVPQPVDDLERVWLTSSAVVALESDGTLVVLGRAEPGDAEDDRWRGLTDERSPLGLPEDVVVDGVVAESRRTVLVDATDSTGRRAWVRCHVGLFACAIAAELDPDDVVPQ